MPEAIRRVWFPALLSALVAAGCGETGEPQSSSQAEQPPPEVGVVTLEAQQVPLYTELPGRTAAYGMAEVRPQVDGVIEAREFKQGAEVEAGETLYQIDPKPYRAAYQSALADLEAARAAVSSVSQREDRFKRLLEDNAVSQQEYDDVKATLDERQAQVEVAKSAVETARIELNYTSVESPIDGRIGPTLVTVGALTTANQAQPLARVTQLDPIYVDIQRSVEELMQLRDALESGRLKRAEPGEARVRLLRENGQLYELEGRLEVSDVTVNQGTGSVTLRAVFPNPEEELLPGMYVRTRLSEGVQEGAILAPQQGVSRNAQGEATALVVNDDDEVVQRRLEIDRAIRNFWLVEDGLAAGDRLIVSGLQRVQPGAAVKPVSEDLPNQPESFERQSGSDLGGESEAAGADADAPASGQRGDGNG